MIKENIIYKPIQKLPEELIIKICAGEVIRTPVCLIKECIENSIDANSSFIQIVLVKGGVEVIQIDDNGMGIKKDDLPLVCERFTTSKLRNINEMLHLRTYGFRGEALFSISQISYLTISSRNMCEKVGHRIDCFGNTKLKIEPCAREIGTTLIINDIFHNFPLRRKTLKAGKIFTEICSLVRKFSLNFPYKRFKVICKDNASKSFNSLDFSKDSLNFGNRNINMDNINKLRKEIIKELFLDKRKSPTFKVLDFKMDIGNSFNANILYSSPFSEYYSKKSHLKSKSEFIFFINNRLVNFPKLKNSVRNVYSIFTSKEPKFLFFVSLFISPTSLDQNVHPAKEFVEMQNEDFVVSEIVEELNKRLKKASNKKVFTVERIENYVSSGSNTIFNNSNDNKEELESESESYSSSVIRSKKFKSDNKENETSTEKLLHTDSNKTIVNSESSEVGNKFKSNSNIFYQSDSPFKVRMPHQRLPSYELQKEMKEKFIQNFSNKENISNNVNSNINHKDINLHKHRHNQKRETTLLKSVFRNLVFVGFFDKRFALLQRTEELLSLKLEHFVPELFYQYLLFSRRYEKLERSDIDLEESFYKFLEMPESLYNAEEDGNEEEIVNEVLCSLERNKSLMEKWGFHIKENQLINFPIFFLEIFDKSFGENEFLNYYRENVYKLVFKLGSVFMEIDFDEEIENGNKNGNLINDEIEKTEKFCSVISNFMFEIFNYIINQDEKFAFKVFENLILPLSMDTNSDFVFYPPKYFVDRDVIVKVTDVKKLFKIFERI